MILKSFWVMAVNNRKLRDGLTLDSDQRVQNDSKTIREIMKRYRRHQSMSDKGNCCDTAAT